MAQPHSQSTFSYSNKMMGSGPLLHKNMNQASQSKRLSTWYQRTGLDLFSNEISSHHKTRGHLPPRLLTAKSNNNNNLFLAAESYSPLPLLLAQHLFSAFMHAVANVKEPEALFQEMASIQPKTGNKGAWKQFTLHYTELSAMARDINGAGLGTLEDVYLSIIPPLSEKKEASQG